MARLLVPGLVAVGLLLALPQWSPVAAQTPCASAAIRSPLRGEVLQGTINVLGSASIDDFNFYKVEWAPADDPENWHAVSTTRPEPVVNGLLDQWDTTRLDDGTYRLKLTVVNSVAQEICRFTVDELLIANHTTPTPEPTATERPRPTPVARTGQPGEGMAGVAAPTATLEPIIPQTPSGGGEVLNPATLLTALRADEWVQAFGQSFAATLVLALLALAYQRRRSRP